MNNVVDELEAPAGLSRESVGYASARRTQRQRVPVVMVSSHLLLDIIMAAVAFALAYYTRANTDFAGIFVAEFRATYIVIFALLTVTLIAVFWANGLYTPIRGRSTMDQLYKIVAGVSESVIISLAIGSFIMADQFIYSRQILITYWVMAIILIGGARGLHGVSVRGLRKRGLAQQRILIVGAGQTGRIVRERVGSAPSLGYKVVAFVDDSATGEIDGIPVRGKISDVADVLRHYRIDEVIIALSGAHSRDVMDIINRCDEESVSIKVCPDAFQIMTNNSMSISEMGGLPLISVKDMTLQGWKRAVKRVVDVCLSAGTLIILSPVMMMVALIIKISSPGPAFYAQERVGLDGETINVLKFRSMKVDAEAQTGAVWAHKDDPRRTKIGSFIRRFSIDELPQFINVLLGEMSIVGPRPERPEFVQQFRQVIPSYMRRHREKAGLTGWAQVNGLRGDTSIEERTRYDLYYIENWSLWFDFKIMAMTLLEVFRGRNAY
jgi:exopolysaccharide biosynthesis polyprenyl glycosylphosphotransferase